jgi:hypothetical protein
MAHQSSGQRQVSAGIVALILAGSLLALWWSAYEPAQAIVEKPPTPPSLPEAKVELPPGLSKADFYRQDILPLLEKSRARNVESSEQAVARLHEEFARFKAGIPDFVDDVASLGTRWHVLQGLTADKLVNYWKESDDPDSEQVKQLMLAKFRAHIMSEGALQKAVESALAQYRDDVTANRNQFLLEAKVALSTHDVRLDFPKPALGAFQKAFDSSVNKTVGQQAGSSLVSGVVALVGSTVAGVAGEQLVAYVIRIMGSEAVAAGVEAATAGGSGMASGGAVGATSGWLGGPLGAVIGVGTGLAVGAVVDWWVTEKFKAHLTEELTTYLEHLEHDLIENTPASDTQGAHIGLRETLRHAADKLYDVERDAVLNALAEAT